MTRRQNYSPIDLDIDGLLLNNYIAASQADWIFTDIKGWTGGPGINNERVQRVVNHGEFPLEGHRTGRPITIDGRVLCQDALVVAEATDAIAACLADGGFGTLTVHDDRLGDRWTTVQLIGAIDDDWSDPTDYRFQLQLLAPSPYKFGTTSSASTGFYEPPAGAGLTFPLFMPSGYLNFDMTGAILGIATVENPGNAPAAVLLEVAGPTPEGGFTITTQSTGKRITWLGDVIPAGSSVVFDGTKGTVVIDGVADRSRDAIIEAWPTVPAGGEESFLFQEISGPTTAAVLTASAVATYY